MTWAVSDIRQFLRFVRSIPSCAEYTFLRQTSFLYHFERISRSIGVGEPRLVLKSRGHGAVADFVGIAEFVEIEQFRRQRFATGVSLALLLVDAQPQAGGFRHSTKLPSYRCLARALPDCGKPIALDASIHRDGALFLLS